MDLKSVNSETYNNELAEALKAKEEIKAPEWVMFVKTSVNKERPTSEEDFWYKRTASILRQIYVKGILGVERLRTRYGGAKRRGGKPTEFRKGSGNIIRKILQQCEKAGLLEKATKKPGRQLTKEGKEFLESIADKVSKSNKGEEK